MESVSEFHHQNADVFRHRHDHFSYRFGLSVVTVFHFVQFGDPVHQHGDFGPKIVLKFLQGVLGVLHGVVKQSRSDRDGADTKLGKNL